MFTKIIISSVVAITLFFSAGNSFSQAGSSTPLPTDKIGCVAEAAKIQRAWTSRSAPLLNSQNGTVAKFMNGLKPLLDKLANPRMTEDAYGTAANELAGYISSNSGVLSNKTNWPDQTRRLNAQQLLETSKVYKAATVGSNSLGTKSLNVCALLKPHSCWDCIGRILVAVGNFMCGGHC